MVKTTVSRSEYGLGSLLQYKAVLGLLCHCKWLKMGVIFREETQISDIKVVKDLTYPLP